MKRTIMLTTNWMRRVAILVAILGTAACSSGADVPPPADDLAAERDEGDDQAGEDEHADETGRVELGEAAFANAGIVVSDVATREVAVAGTSGEAVPGRVEFDPARVVLVSPRTAGRIERLGAVEGDRVQAGQTLAWVLSPAFLTAQTDFTQAVRRADLLAGTDDEQGARALADAARRRLALLGADSSVIERLRAGEPPLDLIPVSSPFAGSIVEAHTLTGAAVEAGSPIFTLADLSVVNVIAEVPERSLAMLRRGQAARVELAAYPDSPVQGTVERIRERLDPETRTAHAVLRVPNPRGLLRSGMFASVRLQADANGRRVALPVVPAEAVVMDGEERYVFVEVGPRTFERRDVDVEPIGGGEVVVRAGLSAGERVVTRGAFTLKSELAKGEFGGHEH
jgi:RND family efflux transporter MFP subunit